MSGHPATCVCVVCIPLRDYRIIPGADLEFTANQKARVVKVLGMIEHRSRRITAGCSLGAASHYRQEREALLWLLEKLGVVERAEKPRRVAA